MSFKDKFSEIRRMSRNYATLLPLKGVFIDKTAFSWYNYSDEIGLNIAILFEFCGSQQLIKPFFTLFAIFSASSYAEAEAASTDDGLSSETGKPDISVSFPPASSIIILDAA